MSAEESNKLSWDKSQHRQYNIPLTQIPRLHYLDPLVDELIELNQPVVITDSGLVKPAVDNWTLDYLRKHLGDSKQTVYQSKDHNFKYCDLKKIRSRTNPRGVEFTPPTRKLDMDIHEFFERMEKWCPGDDRFYLQHSLTASVGKQIFNDFSSFNWEFANGKQTKFKWGSLTSNLLFVAQEGNVTPCHYDEQENFFAQVYGSKRCLLFAPDQFECLYPYPVHHPHDRQSQVDFDAPDLRRFPRFGALRGREALVRPGDVLFIPSLWWHQIENPLAGGATITVNFWFKAGPTSRVYPLQESQKVTIMRNIEKMVMEVLQDPDEVAPLFRRMILGRYTDEGS